MYWVCGESGVLDIEVANPSSVSIQIEKMVLEAMFIPETTGDATPAAAATAIISSLVQLRNLFGRANQYH